MPLHVANAIDIHKTPKVRGKVDIIWTNTFDDATDILVILQIKKFIVLLFSFQAPTIISNLRAIF